MKQSLTDLNEVLDFLATYHGLTVDPNSVDPPSLALPVGLSNLYREHSNWMSESDCFHNFCWGRNLSVSDGAVYGMDCPKDWVVFAHENQAVWVAACPSSVVDDAEVAICTDVGVTKTPSLNRFLIWLFLQESFWVGKNKTPCGHGIGDDTYWSSQGFSEMIDCSFEGGEGFNQLLHSFRLSSDGRVLAQGSDNSSQLASN